MNTAIELLTKKTDGIIKQEISEMCFDIELNIDVNEAVQTTAVSALSEIQAVIKNDDLSEYETIQKIIQIFDKYNLDYLAEEDYSFIK